jgi:hypothetical protein
MFFCLQAMTIGGFVVAVTDSCTDDVSNDRRMDNIVKKVGKLRTSVKVRG